MPYFPQLYDKLRTLQEWFDQAHEQGAEVGPVVREFEKAIEAAARKAAGLKVDPKLAAREPDDLETIRSLRMKGPRQLNLSLDEAGLRDRIQGAWMGRAAGNMLGAPCEGYGRQAIRSTCEALGLPYPMDDYWPIDPKPADHHLECNGLPRRWQLKSGIHCIMPDDDLCYTLLGLLILEEYGLEFTSEDVGRAWLRHLMYGCTAEAVALENLRAGLKPPETGRRNNPDSEWLGADIRADAWGYVCPGMPERAAELAWRDARVSHTRNGIYGSMFFAAAIAAALATGHIRRSLEAGLAEIPKNSRLASGIRETLKWVDLNDGYDRCLDRILERYREMHVGHTINTACVTVAALLYGREDFEHIITLACCGGLDTDCVAATAGSVAGAAMGYRNLPEKWMQPLGNTIRTYIIDQYTFYTDDIVNRFTRLAVRNRIEHAVRG